MNENTTTTKLDTDLTRAADEATIELDADLQQALEGIRVESILVQGGMGMVRRGHEVYLDRPVAIKVLRLQSNGQQLAAEVEQQFKQRFQREARVLATLQHPNIVGCYRAGVSRAGTCFLVMEFIDGPDLRGYLKEHGALAPATALRLIEDTATALEYALERGVIHRDIKAANILLSPQENSTDGFAYVAKLADLGLARPANPNVSDLTQPGAILGTPSTMAPEQFDDPDNVDHRADIYALGCVLLHCLTGQPAFPQKGVNKLIAAKQAREVTWTEACTPSLRQFIQRVLNPDVDQRPKDYASFKSQLRAACEHHGSQKSIGTFLPLAGGIALIGLAVGAFGWYASNAPAMSEQNQASDAASQSPAPESTTADQAAIASEPGTDAESLPPQPAPTDTAPPTPGPWSQPVTTGSGPFLQRFIGWEQVGQAIAVPQEDGDYITLAGGGFTFPLTGTEWQWQQRLQTLDLNSDNTTDFTRFKIGARDETGATCAWTLLNLVEQHKTSIDRVDSDGDLEQSDVNEFIERAPPKDLVVDIAYINGALTITVNGRSLPSQQWPANAVKSKAQGKPNKVFPYIFVENSSGPSAMGFQHGTIRSR